MPSIQRDGAEIHFVREGAGPVVVLLHSLGGSAEMWRTTIDDLRREHTVIVPEARGHGHSTAVPPFTVDRFAADTLAVLDSLGVTSFIAIGLSMGGQTAIRLAQMAPERARALVLADTAFGTATVAAERMALVRKRLGEIGSAEFAREYTASRLQPGTAPGVAAAFAQTVEQTLPDIYVENLTSILGQDLAAAAEAIAAPTLVMVGENDTSTPPKMAQDLCAAIRGARLKILPDANHLSNLDQPRLFNSAVADFLAGQVRPGRASKEVGH